MSDLETAVQACLNRARLLAAAAAQSLEALARLDEAPHAIDSTAHLQFYDAASALLLAWNAAEHEGEPIEQGLRQVAAGLRQARRQVQEVAPLARLRTQLEHEQETLRGQGRLLAGAHDELDAARRRLADTISSARGTALQSATTLHETLSHRLSLQAITGLTELEQGVARAAAAPHQALQQLRDATAAAGLHLEVPSWEGATVARTDVADRLETAAGTISRTHSEVVATVEPADAEVGQVVAKLRDIAAIRGCRARYVAD